MNRRQLLRTGAASLAMPFAAPAIFFCPGRRGEPLGRHQPHRDPEGLRLAESEAPAGWNAGRVYLQPALPRALGRGSRLLGE